MEKEQLRLVAIFVMELGEDHALHVRKKDSFHVLAKEVMMIAGNVEVLDGDLAQTNGASTGLKCVGAAKEVGKKKKTVLPAMAEELLCECNN